MRGARTVWAWLRSAAGLRFATAASVLANSLIVVTGGAVRLSASGLGCPTWPKCTDASLVRTDATGIHGAIEFTNRMLTFVLFVVAVATLIAAIGQRRQIWLAALALAGIPAQAVLGGISVLTHLNPWVVSAHLLLSMAILALTVLLWWRVRDPRPRYRRLPTSRRPARAAPAVLLAGLVVVFTALVLMAGTVVTGSGPHSGSVSADGRRIHRNGLTPASMAQLHADLVMVLIGLTVGLVLLLRTTDAARATYRAAVVLLGVELAQGLIGFVQYFTHLPVLLVGAHMAGACVVWVTALVTALRVAADDGGRETTPGSGPSEQLGDDVDEQPDQRPDHGAVHPDELQVPADLQLEPAAGVRGVPAAHGA
jgi:heme a synthase